MRIDRQSRYLHFGRGRRVVVQHAARVQVLASDLQELPRQQLGRVGAPVKRRVHHDGIESLGPISEEPPSSVVDHDVDFRVRQDRRHLRYAPDKGQIARIDLYDGEPLELRMVGDHLCP